MQEEMSYYKENKNERKYELCKECVYGPYPICLKDCLPLKYHKKRINKE